MRRSMTPSARQFDGIATRTVSGSGGRACTLPAGVSGTASAFSITIVELAKLRPTSASHLTAGVIAGWPAAASEAPKNATMAVPARKDVMVTCIALISGHIASPTAIPPFPLRLTFLDGSDAAASAPLHHCRASEYIIGLPSALLFRSVFAKDSCVHTTLSFGSPMRLSG